MSRPEPALIMSPEACLSQAADVAPALQSEPEHEAGINESMNEQDTTPGIEVHEQVLNRFERGYLTGVYEAWAARTLTEADFREAMEVLIAQGEQQEERGPPARARVAFRKA
jgi:hypothetical protein